MSTGETDINSAGLTCVWLPESHGICRPSELHSTTLVNYQCCKTSNTALLHKAMCSLVIQVRTT
jgi:hypothetical protein